MTTVAVGDEIPAFTPNDWLRQLDRYAAVNDEFVPIHMDDEAGRAAGMDGAFGMGNLQWAYLHNVVRDWLGDPRPESSAWTSQVPGGEHQGADRDRALAGSSPCTTGQ